MDKFDIKIMKQLSETMGVSSCEYNICEILEPELKKYSLGIKYDKLGSIFAYKKSENSTAKTLLIATSLDEVGMMISDIDKNNKVIHFITLEDLDVVSLLHQRISIYTRNNEKIIGVICGKNINNLYIKLVNNEDFDKCTIGDLIVLESNFEKINNYVIGKALDNRIFLSMLLKFIDEIKAIDLDYNIVIGGIASSIIGQRGSMTVSFAVKPDITLVLTSFDTNDSNVKIDNGAVIALHDKGLLPNQKLLSYVLSKQFKQKSIGSLVQNDGAFIHKMLKGCPTLALGIAMENTKTANVIASLNDLDDLLNKIKAICLELNSLEINKIGATNEF